MKVTFLTIWSFFALVLIVPTAMSATNNRSTTAAAAIESERLWQLILQTQQKLEAASTINKENFSFHQALAGNCQIEHPEKQLAKALKLEAQQYQSNYGISVRGGYTSDSLNDNTGDPNAYLELSWNIWRQGYAENKRRAQSLAQQANVSQLRAELAQQKLNGQCRRYQAKQTFSGLLSHLLNLKLGLMQPVYHIEKRAYFKNWSYLDDLLVSDQDLKLLTEELAFLNNNAYMDAALNQVQNLPVIDLDIQAFINSIRTDIRFEKIWRLEKQALSDKINVADDDRLRIFVRKQFDVGNTNEQAVVAGLRFSIPLEKRTKLAEQYRLAHIDSNAKLQAWERISRTRAAYQSVREQLQRTTKQQYRVLRANERLRRTLIQKRLDDEVQLATAVSRLRSSLDASIELIRAKEELYRRVNQVFMVASIKFDPAFIKVSSLNENNYRARNGERSIYIWSKGFNRFNNDDIFSFLKAKNISRVLLTASRKIKRKRMFDFIQQARQQQIKVESIAGKNNAFFRKNHSAVAIEVEAAAALSDAVHLDIEPHTFAGYKQNKTSYLKQYIEMLRAIRKQSPDIILTVAVPFHWPDAIYAALDSLVDRVYIMNYGSTKIATFIRRLQPALRNIQRKKIIPVLRISDFDNEWQMEKMINTLQQRTGLRRYSLHTFRHFVQKASQ